MAEECAPHSQHCSLLWPRERRQGEEILLRPAVPRAGEALCVMRSKKRLHITVAKGRRRVRCALIPQSLSFASALLPQTSADHSPKTFLLRQKTSARQTLLDAQPPLYSAEAVL